MKIPTPLFLGTLLALAGCASTPVEDKPIALPFGVAILPMAVDEIKRAPRSYPDARPLEIKLALDSQEVTSELSSELARASFVRVRPVSTEFATDTPVSVLVRQAQELEADLLLQCFLLYTPTVHGKGSEMFWWNILIQSLGGPFSWWVRDRTFLAPAELEVRVFDVRTVAREGILDRRFAIHTSRVKFEDISLALWDRTGYVPNYMASVVFPVGLMAKDNEVIQGRLEEEISRALSAAVARDIQEKKDLLLLAETVAPFYVDVDSVRVNRGGDGQVQVRGDVILKEGIRAESLRRFALRAGNDVPREIPFLTANRALDEDLGSFGDRYYRYRINESLPAPEGSDIVHLTVWDDHDTQRSFTFRVE
jgi:hypothetical protein